MRAGPVAISTNIAMPDASCCSATSLDAEIDVGFMSTPSRVIMAFELCTVHFGVLHTAVMPVTSSKHCNSCKAEQGQRCTAVLCG